MPNKQDILNTSILIVDDQQSNVLLLEDMLREEGYTSFTSTNNPSRRSLKMRSIFTYFLDHYPFLKMCCIYISALALPFNVIIYKAAKSWMT